ncbi:hypothetical protein ACFQZO_14635 [Bradyrhizobium sp. GCM10027634]|uniref:hypothetical protein n=1 Tax=unclassified Bradyrhizobium TaxID=2631580 RepID=UPI00188AEEF1|nr:MULTISPECIES: hypothetical protein [unclassified Bradyrhizobium]MDN5002123.1 hypothetical protein [Bradyrhizobium sp. WYCCWR 12677]QOZ45619.1 hypothetical protein XH89_20630 [Bradyrhizobium sp. CCBAU 53340]
MRLDIGAVSNLVVRHLTGRSNDHGGEQFRRAALLPGRASETDRRVIAANFDTTDIARFDETFRRWPSAMINTGFYDRKPRREPVCGNHLGARQNAALYYWSLTVCRARSDPAT